MKKILVTCALLGFTAGVVQAAEVTTNYSEFHKKIVQSIPQQKENKNSAVYKPAKDNNYILKYNVDDLESAPWNNGGKRKLN
ncbi:hypothetical protein IJ579_03635 [bacterium]|nr:hypothetical protein [bacterium]